jgi:hypothetical protein
MTTKRGVNASASRLTSGFGDDALDAVDSRNEQMLDSLADKSRRLLDMSRIVRDTLRDDHTQLDALSMSMETGTGVVAKGRAIVAGITDDPTCSGVMKIAMLVFWTLTIGYFSIKYLYRFCTK